MGLDNITISVLNAKTIYNALSNHCLHLDSISCIQGSTKWLVIENDLPVQIPYMKHHIENNPALFPGAIIFNERLPGKKPPYPPGVRKGKKGPEYVAQMKKFLSNDQLKFSQALFTKTPSYSLDLVLQVLFSQLENWSLSGLDKFSGKKNGSENDDISLALHMLPYWVRYVIAEKNNLVKHAQHYRGIVY